MSLTTQDTSQVDDVHKNVHTAKLLRMAGQIADFFKSYPDEEAAAAIADHINQFWTHHMREDFLAAFSNDSNELSPLLRKARGSIKAKRTRD